MNLPINFSDQLARFLVQAKKNTYATKGDDEINADPSEKIQYKYREQDFYYFDSYYGYSRFAGQEFVCYKEIPVWSMAYYGGIISLGFSSGEIKKTYQFLRKALRKVPLVYPFRGPLNEQSETLQYINRVKGELDFFHGVEEILFQGRKIYELRYVGGWVSNSPES